MKDREQRLLVLITKATGHEVVRTDSPADEEELPDNIAEDSGLLVSAAE